MNFNRCVEISRALFNPNEHSARCFHTTFIIRRGKIQTIGINSSKSHTRNLKFNYFKDGVDLREITGTHSEMSAIIKHGRENCYDCTFVNVRIDREGKIKNSCPCAGCQSLFLQVGFKKIYFSNNSGGFDEFIHFDGIM